MKAGRGIREGENNRGKREREEENNSKRASVRERVKKRDERESYTEIKEEGLRQRGEIFFHTECKLASVEMW